MKVLSYDLQTIYCSAERDTLKTKEALDERSCRDPAYLNRLVEGTIFGMSNIIFHSARDGKSVLISVCETHLQPTRETVHAGGKHTHIDARTYTHTAAKKFVKKIFVSVDKTVRRDHERRSRGGCRGETER